MAAEEEAPLQDQDIAPHQRAFASHELVACSACTRPNPPNRATCLYCGFPITTTAQVSGKLTDAVEQAKAVDSGSFIITIASPRVASDEQIKRLATLAHSAIEDARRALSGARVLPVCSTSTPEAADAVCAKLKSLGLAASIVLEEELNLSSAAINVRRLKVEDKHLKVETGREQMNMGWQDATLMVVGRLQLVTSEVEKKAKHNRVLAERRLSTDEAVLDLYQRESVVPWRIRSNNFDYNCLEEKSLTTFENFARLVELLKQRALKAEFDDTYIRLRSMLDVIWPVEAGEELRQKRRAGWREVQAAIIQSNNDAQFDRYSRLRQIAVLKS